MICPAYVQMADANVLVQIFSGGREFAPGDFMGILAPGAEVEVVVSVIGRRNMEPVAAYVGVDGQEKPAVCWITPTEFEGGKQFTHTVVMDEKGLPRWPTNRISVLVEEAGGGFAYYTAGVFAQEFKSRAWAQLAGEGQIFRDANGAIGVNANTQTARELVMGLAQDGRYDRRSLPVGAPESSANEIVPDMTGVNPGEALVQWFNPLMGLGYAWYMTGNGPVSAKVHFSQIPPRGDRQAKFLLPGDVIAGKLEWSKPANGSRAGEQIAEVKKATIVRMVN